MSLSAPPGSGRSRVVAVLGPTNTGKTHLAMERMLGHPSGMIGFPLRLLARENYDRAVAAKGSGQVALITGEEKILPPHARYFLCTVESMPLDRAVAFLAVDEIQMCADPDRGHLFTDRLLHARGEVETMFMGAETIRPLLRRLVPAAEHESRPRFSSLQYTGAAKLSRLPPRSAVVAFSVADVYALAELVRRQRGGTALVLGALSPRTRNAQVAMYQAGEVDYLVATDAIGMGLNMHVDHVAFAASRKFDGRAPRTLTPAEMAQIAGRAGRFTKNGTFGTTAERGALEEEMVDRIENHRFDALKSLFWRHSELNFASLATLRASLARLPARAGLVRAREADDELVLAALSHETDIAASAHGHAAVRLLWEVCQIPDFGKVTGEGHARLLGQIYRSLAGLGGTRKGRLPAEWIARQVERLDRVDGDIEALTQRIAGIRTWTYVSHRPDWLDDASGWQERTRGIEDKLSDALHERLIQRFVDRRTATLVGRMRKSGELIAAVTAEGGVLLEGHGLGRLEGFRFLADAPEADRTEATASRAVTAAAVRALAGEIEDRVRRLESDDDEAIALADDGRVLWRDAAVGRLIAGPDVLRPQIEPLASDLLGGGQRERIRVRLSRWLNRHLRDRLAPLFLAESAAVATAARGLLFQVAEGLGSLPRAQAAAQILAIANPERRTLAAAGLKFGSSAIYFPALLKPSAMKVRAILWCTAAGISPMPPPPPGRTSVPVQVGHPGDFYEACGFRVVGPRAVRIDVVERVLGVAHKMLAAQPVPSLAPLASLLGCPPAEVTALLAALGFSAEESEDGVRLRFVANAGRRSGKRRQKPAPGVATPADSPFAKLRALCGSR